MAPCCIPFGTVSKDAWVFDSKAVGNLVNIRHKWPDQASVTLPSSEITQHMPLYFPGVIPCETRFIPRGSQELPTGRTGEEPLTEYWRQRLIYSKVSHPDPPLRV